MFIQSIIQQGNGVDAPSINWSGAASGNYNTLTGVQYTNLFVPATEGVNTYNHHAHIKEFGGELHAMYSTSNADEPAPGLYVRYQKSTDLGATWSSSVTLFESQDDINEDYTTTRGRQCMPTGFAIVNGELYGVTDVNDLGPNDENRAGVGVLARKINSNGSFGVVEWIENVDGTFDAPNPITGYPTYSFNQALREDIRNFYLSNPENLPTWYYSVPLNDPLRSRFPYSSGEVTEPSAIELNNGNVFKLFRGLGVSTDFKLAQAGASLNNMDSIYVTNIPDFPSRTKILKLNDGRVAIIGNNQNANRTPLFLAICDESFNISSANLYNVDTETTGASFSGFGKGTGVQYPDACQLSNGKLAVMYSVNKEDIRVATFDIPELL